MRKIFGLCVLALMADAPRAEDKSYPVQVIDMGNSAQSVPLTLQWGSDEQHSWFASDKAMDPLKFTALRLKGNKRHETPPEGFVPVDVPQSLTKYFGKQPKPASFWYYKSFIAPSNPRATLAFRLGRISDTDEVYLNGVSIGHSGDPGGAHAWDKIRVYDIPTVLMKPLEKNILLVRVDSYFEQEFGILADRLEIGESARLNRELISTDMPVLVFLSCYITFGIYFLFLYIRRPQEKAYPLFFIFIVMLVLYQFFQTQVKYTVSADFFGLKRLEYITLLGIFPAFYFYARTFFRMQSVPYFRQVHKFMPLLLVANAVVLGTVLMTSDIALWARLNELIHLNATMPAFVILSLAMVIYKIVQKDRDAQIMVSGLVFLLITLVIDNLIYRGILNMPRISSYAIFMFIVSLALILANQFVRVHNQVEELNHNLEQKVEERTRELQDTLKKVQDLKSQQDGDYFLTSLLIEPLSANRVVSERTQVQFYVKEKKEFSFRRWSRDIGGDMCVAHTITLRGHKFTVALNGDAMGKSMQGAGGALVLGSVFASIIERTRNTAEVRNYSPETWLKQAFFELNRVFESFDGSMLVSVVLTAIDDEAGVMYYINAEHPWTVLYRNGKATFTDEELALRKLGTLGVNENVQVKVFYLQDKDIVIMGSDGRDDLILGIDHEGQRIINEDETLILRHVEASGADLGYLVQELRKSGEFSDDLSFVRIEYHAPPNRIEPIKLAESEAIENFKSGLKTTAKPLTLSEIDGLLEKHRRNSTEMHHAVRWLYQNKQYAKGADWAEKFVLEYPMESEFLYLAGFGYKLAGNYDRALDFAERLFARNQSHEKNLINLIDLRLISGGEGEAQQALNILIKFYPHNDKIPRFVEALKEAGKSV